MSENVVVVDDEFSFKHDGTCWVLMRSTPVTKPDSSGITDPTKMAVKRTYYSKPEQLFAAILDNSASSATIESVADLKNHWSLMMSRIEAVMVARRKASPKPVPRKQPENKPPAKKNFPSWKREKTSNHFP